MGKFWAAYARCRAAGQREGQSRINALALVAPEIADEVVGTSLDCFYDDSRVPEFDSVFMGGGH